MSPSLFTSVEIAPVDTPAPNVRALPVDNPIVPVTIEEELRVALALSPKTKLPVRVMEDPSINDPDTSCPIVVVVAAVLLFMVKVTPSSVSIDPTDVVAPTELLLLMVWLEPYSTIPFPAEDPFIGAVIDAPSMNISEPESRFIPLADIDMDPTSKMWLVFTVIKLTAVVEPTLSDRLIVVSPAPSSPILIFPPPLTSPPNEPA